MALTLKTEHQIPISSWAVITQPGGPTGVNYRLLGWIGQAWTYRDAFYDNAEEFPMSIWGRNWFK